MIEELESLEMKTEIQIENEALRADNKRLTNALLEANLKIEKLEFEMRRKPRREFVAVPYGN